MGARTLIDRAAWGTFWSQLPTSQPAPEIDFDRVTLLVFIVDGHPSGRRRPTVDRVERRGDVAVVYWRIDDRAAAPSSVSHPNRAFMVAGLVGHKGLVEFRRVE